MAETATLSSHVLDLGRGRSHDQQRFGLGCAQLPVS